MRFIGFFDIIFLDKEKRFALQYFWSMIKTWKITIPELSGDEVRRVYVYLPASYRPKDDVRYPVLYMFDGHNVFFDDHATYGKSWGMGNYLNFTRTPVIVAAVECSHIGNGRLEEYSPFSFEDETFGSVTGRGQAYMDWLVNEFKPYIDNRFKTIPDREHTMICGSSMGGLMSLYAISAYNHIFSACAALSPSIWVSKQGVREMFETAQIDENTVVYMNYGSEEMVNHKKMLTEYANYTSFLIKRKVNLTSQIVKGGMHCEASWEQQIPVFMRCLGF